MRTVLGYLIAARPLPNYDHFHHVDALPRALHADSRTVIRGYATGMGGSIPQTWVFFEHLEPALPFSRAGRMSCFDIRSYGVYEAGDPVRLPPEAGRAYAACAQGLA